jgi:mono/diheme cytochrome c family protein
MTTMRGWTFVVALALAAGCGDNNDVVPPDAAPDARQQSLVERGQYVMNVLGACTFCHTPLLPNGMRDLDNVLAGVDCFFDLDSPTGQDNGNGFGCLSTRNLTNHATGLANATDSQIKAAFQNGIRTDGKTMVPVMPYWVFHNMTDDDADAVVAYMRSVPPRDHQVKPNEPPWTDINDAPGIVVPIIRPEQIPMPRGGENNQSAMRGRYLSSMAGLCMDCHTPETAPFSLNLDMSRAYGGGRVFPKEALGLIDPAFPPAIITRNLTPHSTGLEGWTRDQIKKAIGEGRDPDNNQVCAGTHGALTSPYAALERQDLDDIVEYIFQLPPVDNDTAAENCGPPPVDAPETGTQCNNNTDDDGDGVPNDGCFVPCGDCAGPPVP